MSEHDARDRYSLYRLCECPPCEGRGKIANLPYVSGPLLLKCAECRGEGKVRQEVASCETPEAVGVALVTLGREQEWQGCAFGLLDRTPECETCGGTGDGNTTPEHGWTILDKCSACKGSGVKPTGAWILTPWLPSPRNVSDAGRVLARSKNRA